MEPEFVRDVTVATVLIAAIVALAADSIALGAGVLGVAAALMALVVLIRHGDRQRRRSARP